MNDRFFPVEPVSRPEDLKLNLLSSEKVAAPDFKRLGLTGVPEWACYVTKDHDGRVCLHATKPICRDGVWYSQGESSVIGWETYRKEPGLRSRRLLWRIHHKKVGLFPAWPIKRGRADARPML